MYQVLLEGSLLVILTLVRYVLSLTEWIRSHQPTWLASKMQGSAAVA